MTRGDVYLVRIPHPPGVRGKRRPAVVVQSDAYAGAIGTAVVAEATSNLLLRSDPACLFVAASSPEGQAAGLKQDSVFSCLMLSTVGGLSGPKIGTLSPALMRQLDDCLRVALGL